MPKSILGSTTAWPCYVAFLQCFDNGCSVSCRLRGVHGVLGQHGARGPDAHVEGCQRLCAMLTYRTGGPDDNRSSRTRCPPTSAHADALGVWALPGTIPYLCASRPTRRSPTTARPPAMASTILQCDALPFPSFVLASLIGHNAQYSPTCEHKDKV